MKLSPLGDKVVLKQLEAEETTASGIVLPGNAQEKPQQAEVIAVGPSVTFTVSASLFTPLSRAALASAPNLISFAIIKTS